MDLQYKYQAYYNAQEFESIYDYSEQYKIRNNAIVWKYMNLFKFESLLNNKAHFFAKPGAFIDPLEGSYSHWDMQQYNDLERPLVISRDNMKKIQEFSAISCWHINEYESAGMWDLYLSGEDGVAIKTDYKSLMTSITDLRYRVFSGKLQYVDFHKEMTSRNIYDTLFYKRKSFAHENELRLMIIASRFDQYILERKFDMEGIPIYMWEEKFLEYEEESYNFSHEKGNLVSCNLHKLIQAIYVSPKSSKEVVEKVKLMASQYGISENKVIQSDLYKDFIY